MDTIRLTLPLPDGGRLYVVIDTIRVDAAFPGRLAMIAAFSRREDWFEGADLWVAPCTTAEPLSRLVACLEMFVPLHGTLHLSTIESAKRLGAGLHALSLDWFGHRAVLLTISVPLSPLVGRAS